MSNVGRQQCSSRGVLLNVVALRVFVELVRILSCHRLHTSSAVVRVSPWALPHVGRARSLRTPPDWRQRHRPPALHLAAPCTSSESSSRSASALERSREQMLVSPWGRRRACRNARGSRLALVACERGGGYSALMQRPSRLSPRLTPNPSIEGTCSGGLRPPPHAPHVER